MSSSKKKGGRGGASGGGGGSPAPMIATPTKRKSQLTFGEIRKSLSAIKGSRREDNNEVTLDKVPEYADKDVYSRESQDLLFSAGEKTAERVRITASNHAIRNLYRGFQELCGVGEKDRPEFGGIV